MLFVFVEMVTWCFPVLISFIRLIGFYILNQPSITRDKSQLVMVCSPFCVLLDSFAIILLRIFAFLFIRDIDL